MDYHLFLYLKGESPWNHWMIWWGPSKKVFQDLPAHPISCLCFRPSSSAWNIVEPLSPAVEVRSVLLRVTPGWCKQWVSAETATCPRAWALQARKRPSHRANDSDYNINTKDYNGHPSLSTCGSGLEWKPGALCLPHSERGTAEVHDIPFLMHTRRIRLQKSDESPHLFQHALDLSNKVTSHLTTLKSQNQTLQDVAHKKIDETACAIFSPSTGKTWPSSRTITTPPTHLHPT